MIGPSAIAKKGVLIDEFAEARVGDPEVEGETAGAQMLVRHHRGPRRQPAWKAKADAAELPEIMVGSENQRVGLCTNGKRHADTTANSEQHTTALQDITRTLSHHSR